MKNKIKNKKEKRERLILEGVVVDCFRGCKFLVKVSDTYTINVSLCGKMRENFIKVVTGDKVQVEVSPFDPNNGRIVGRLK